MANESIEPALTHSRCMNRSPGPVIVAGMHRSGTSLLGRILREGGLFLGCDAGTSMIESRFFVQQNMTLLKLAGADWNRPETAAGFFSRPQFQAYGARMLTERCSAQSSRQFIGHRGWRRGHRLRALPFPWGWKDPRNSLTLPFWLRVFPESRIVLIVRNAVDVADSLLAREQRLQTRRRKYPIVTRIRELFGLEPTRQAVHLNWESAVSLWISYNSAALETIDELHPSTFWVVRFEDLLDNPKGELEKLSQFAGLSPHPGWIHCSMARIDKNRGRAFLADPRLRCRFEEIKDHPLMIRFGYDQFMR